MNKAGELREIKTIGDYVAFLQTFPQTDRLVFGADCEGNTFVTPSNGTEINNVEGTTILYPFQEVDISELFRTPGF